MFKDLTGKKYNKLIVIKQDGWYINPDNSRSSKWLCKCDCGKEKSVIGASLNYGNTQSCGCLNDFPKNKLDKGIAALNQLYNKYKYSSKKRNFIFNLSIEQFKIFIKQNCKICGVEPLQILGNKDCNGKLKYNGIDRINNKLGYIFENCRTMCKICNRAKRELSEEEFQEWVKRMRSYRGNE